MLQKRLELISRHDGTVFLRFGGAGPDMWHQQRVGPPQQHRVGKISHVTAKLTVIQRRYDSLSRDNFLPGEIEQAAPFFKMGQHLLINEASSAI